MNRRPLAPLVLAMTLGAITASCDGGDDGPPPPPIVFSMSPSSGPYGTEVTIVGEHFGDPASSHGLEFDGVRSLGTTEWTDTMIRFRVPFPGDGVVTVRGPGGSVDAGTFTPDPIPWTVSRNLGSLPVAAVLLSNGNVGAVMRTAASDPDASVVSVTELGTVTSRDLGRTVTGLALINAFETDPGRFEAFFGASGSVVEHLAWPAGSEPDLHPIDVNAVSALVGAHDVTGTYLWVVESNESSIARVRAPALVDDVWAPDLELTIPFSVQNPTMALRGAVAVDDRLFVTWGRSVGTVLDQMAEPTLSTLAPSTSTWTHTSLGGDLDDYVLASETQIAPDGSRALVGYCWTDRDFDPWDPTDPEVSANCVHDHYEGAVGLGGVPNEDEHLNVLVPSGLATVDGNETDGYTVHTPTEDLSLSLWPARPKWLLYDEAGGAVLLVEASGTYVIRPAP